MEVVSLLLAVAAVVLAVAGVAKLLDPAATATMLASVGLPIGPVAVRGIGLAELGLGVVVLTTAGAAPPALMALAYAMFATTLWRLRQRSPATPCGCIGSWSGPPRSRHLVLNSSGAAIGVVAAATGTTAWPPTVTGWALAAYAVGVGAGSIAAIALLGDAQRSPGPERLPEGRA